MNVEQSSFSGMMSADNIRPIDLSTVQATDHPGIHKREVDLVHHLA